MAKIIDFEGKLPKHIEEYVIYPLNKDIIIRRKSGFTSKALKKASKYEACRQNASEFGRVSSFSKSIRAALTMVLPKANKLAVVNGLTQRMRAIMVCDTQAVKGERTVAGGLATDAGRALLVGYAFNPMVSLPFDYEIAMSRNLLGLKARELFVFPKEATHIGFRMHGFVFDFEQFEHAVETGGWSFFKYKRLPSTLVLQDFALKAEGLRMVLLEFQYFVLDDGAYVPMVDDGSKQLVVLGISE